MCRGARLEPPISSRSHAASTHCSDAGVNARRPATAGKPGPARRRVRFLDPRTPRSCCRRRGADRRLTHYTVSARRDRRRDPFSRRERAPAPQDPVEEDLPLLVKPHFAYAPNQVPPKLDILNTRLLEADAYVAVTPEYNHAPSPALLNMINHIGSSVMSYKPSLIVSYSAGQWGGARAAVLLRPMLSEMGCLPVSAMIHARRRADITGHGDAAAAATPRPRRPRGRDDPEAATTSCPRQRRARPRGRDDLEAATTPRPRRESSRRGSSATPRPRR